MMLVLDIDPRCIFGGYVSSRYGSAVYVLAAIYVWSNYVQAGALRPLKVVSKSLVVLCRCFLPMDLCLFQWLIYKVLHLSPCSNLVLWGAICYTIFSHLSSYPDNEPTSCLVTWTLCLSVTPPHIPKYLAHLCLAIRQVSPSDQNLEMLKFIFFYTAAPC